MNRSVTSRNLAGGFLGGVVGVLVSWYVAPIAMSFGVLLGVLVGWWLEDIAKAFVDSLQYALGIWQQRDRVWVAYHTTFRHYGANLLATGRKVVSAIQYVALLPLLFLLPLALVRRFRQWATHPTGTALLISISAIVVGAVINAVAFGMLWPWPETTTVGGGVSGKPLEVVPFGFANIAFVTCITTMFLTMFGGVGMLMENDEDNSTRNFYARWERYSQYSPITYFARELFRFLKSEMTVAVFFAMAITYWVTLGGALIALVIIPVAMFVTFMVGLYKIAQRSAHWWCFGVTLVVTGISALTFYGSFGNEAVLWTVALCAGTVSGMAAEGLRRLGLWWSNTAMGQHYFDIWYDEDKMLPFSIATPVWRSLWRVFDGMGQCMIRFAA